MDRKGIRISIIGRNLCTERVGREWGREWGERVSERVGREWGERVGGERGERGRKCEQQDCSHTATKCHPAVFRVFSVLLEPVLL